MIRLKKLGVLAVVVLALSAIGAASASAATFTYSATGSISGKALETQVWGFSGGKFECTSAATSGTISSTAFTEQHVTVTYGSCKAFGFATVDLSPSTYLYTAAGSVHLKSPFTITPTVFGSSACTVTVAAQNVSTVDYANSGASNLKVTPTGSKIKYTSTGGPCGASGENGTYTGASELSRVGGGTIRFDP